LHSLLLYDTWDSMKDMKDLNVPIKVSYSKFGLPGEVLDIEPLSLVKPGRGEVAIRLLASPINPVDGIIIMGHFSSLPQLPEVPGVEGVGEIYAIGESVDKSLINKRVRMPQESGAWRDSVTAKVDELMFVSNDVDLKMASMAFINPPTAWGLLHNYVALKPGDWIVQNAANSGVGICVIQLAKHFGFKTINIVRDLSWEKPLMEMGADVVLKEGSEWYKDPKYMSTAKLALNPVGGTSIAELINLLAPNGVHVSYGGLSSEPSIVPVFDLMVKNITMNGFILFNYFASLPQKAVQDIMDNLFDFMKKGIIDIPVEKTYLLQDVKKAIAHAEGYHRKGKILLISNWSPPTE